MGTTESTESTDTSTTFSFDLFPVQEEYTMEDFFPTPTWTFYTDWTEYLIFGLSIVGAMLVETLSNFSVLGQIDIDAVAEPTAFNSTYLCLDSLGEVAYGLFSMVILGYRFAL